MRAEMTLILLGLGLVAVAAVAVDWRLGTAVVGVGFILSTIDVRRRS